jgi:hypothetical protein
MRRRSDYQLDHEIPLQIGGRHDPSNVQPLCVTCTAARRLSTKPSSPRLSAGLARRAQGRPSDP